MRRANLGNMFASLLASGWINQLHAQTPSTTTDAKIGKVFHETCQTPQGARGHNHYESATRRPVPIYGKRSNITSTLEVSPSRGGQLQVVADGPPDIPGGGDRFQAYFDPTANLWVKSQRGQVVILLSAKIMRAPSVT
jgi:hypothetical protein